MRFVLAQVFGMSAAGLLAGCLYSIGVAVAAAIATGAMVGGGINLAIQLGGYR